MGNSTKIKAQVARVLPAPVLRRMISVRDTRRLRSHPREAIDPRHLRTITRAELDAMLRDRAIDEHWNHDGPRIASVFEERAVGDAVNPGDRRALYYLVATVKPSRVLEIGTNVGGSTLAMTQALATHAESEASLTTLDIVDVNGRGPTSASVGAGARTPAENLELLGLRSRVSFVVQASLDYMRSTDDRFDLVLVDGDHAAVAVYRDVAAAVRLLRSGGVLVLHDYYPERQDLFGDRNVITGPFDAVRRLLAENAALALLPLGTLPWETKLGTRLTTLALLTTR